MEFNVMKHKLNSVPFSGKTSTPHYTPAPIIDTSAKSALESV